MTKKWTVIMGLETDITKEERLIPRVLPHHLGQESIVFIASEGILTVVDVLRRNPPNFHALKRSFCAATATVGLLPKLTGLSSDGGHCFGSRAGRWCCPIPIHARWWHLSAGLGGGGMGARHV
eukprot:GDKJ01060120.1.p2 GENE.GDKJ01060120.1~~GDKJ01060120.1.p2  ORF type:complete len:123 (+),score=6.19 GDKJ01060120.1:292-660(+)